MGIYYKGEVVGDDETPTSLSLATTSGLHVVQLSVRVNRVACDACSLHSVTLPRQCIEGRSAQLSLALLPFSLKHLCFLGLSRPTPSRPMLGIG